MVEPLSGDNSEDDTIPDQIQETRLGDGCSVGDPKRPCAGPSPRGHGVLRRRVVGCRERGEAPESQLLRGPAHFQHDFLL